MRSDGAMRQQEAARILDARIERLGGVRPSRLNREAWRAADSQMVHRLLDSGIDRDQVSTLVRKYSAEVGVLTATWGTAEKSTRQWREGAGTAVRLARKLRIDRANTRVGETAWQWLGWLASFRYRERLPRS